MPLIGKIGEFTTTSVGGLKRLIASLSNVTGDYEVRTVDGDVVITVPAGKAVRFKNGAAEVGIIDEEGFNVGGGSPPGGGGFAPFPVVTPYPSPAPTLIAATGGELNDVVVNYADYTRMGDLVHFAVKVTWSGAQPGKSGDVTFQNWLPFPTRNIAGGVQGFNFYGSLLFSGEELMFIAGANTRDVFGSSLFRSTGLFQTVGMAGIGFGTSIALNGSYFAEPEV